MTKDEIDNAAPIARLITAFRKAKEAHEDINEAIESIIARDDKLGLYKIRKGPRQEQVLLLKDEGLSNRQIAKVLGVNPATVDRDVIAATAANAAPTAANAAPTKAPKPDPILIEQAKAEAREEARLQYEAEIQQHLATIKELEGSSETLEAELSVDYKKTIADLQERLNRLEIALRAKNDEHANLIEEIKTDTTSKSLKKGLKDKEEEIKQLKEHINVIHLKISDITRENSDLKSGKLTPNFRGQLRVMNSSVAALIQADTLVKMLIELEEAKENLEFDHDMEGLEALIQELNSLSNRAKKWAERITPVNDRWVYRKQQKGK
jgi:transposase